MMRRQDRMVTDGERIHDIIKRCHVMRFGFCDNGQVYIVPLNFGYRKTESGYVFYFHGAAEGRKIDLIRTSPNVGFEMDASYELETPKDADKACVYSAKYESIIGNGVAEIVTDSDERIAGLNLMMEHYTGRSAWTFHERMLAEVCVFKLTVTEMSCKARM